MIESSSVIRMSMYNKAAAFFLAVCIMAPAYAVNLYRWVDESGNIHYSDRVPPDQSDKERARLNQHGVSVEYVQAAKSTQELAREKQLARLREAQGRMVMEQQARDRVLLTTFRNEEDLMRTRDSKISTVDAQIAVAKATTERLTDRLAGMQTEAAIRERKGERLSDLFLAEIDSIRRQIEDEYRLIVQREKERESIQDRYDRDLKRFRELKVLDQKLAANTKDDAEGKASPLIDTLIECRGSNECGKYWEKAMIYAKRNATTPVKISSERIMATAPPMADSDIAVTVSRIRGGEDIEHIFLDVHCRDTVLGQEFCTGKAVNRIRSRFRKAISAL